MQYLEDIENGACVLISGEYFVVTSDFKSSGNRLLISLVNGSPRWFSSSVMVESVDIFTFDKETNILPIKPNNNAPQNILNKTTDIR